MPRLPWEARTRAERTILLVAASAFALGAPLVLAAAKAWSLKPCLWKNFTGLPCPTCGATRSMVCLARGDWAAAVAMNPAAVTALCVACALVGYSLAVVLLRLEPLRPAWVTVPRIRWLVVGCLVANWAYLIGAGKL